MIKNKNPAYEVNFDGIVGPTHNYTGLSYGNIASTLHKEFVSHPREAALQGLRKMKSLASIGLKQAVLPPQERPHIPTLRKLGFYGSDQEVLAQVAKNDPLFLALCSSASAMWTANAATISPSADSADRKLHITPAVLSHKFHRSLETRATKRILERIFSCRERFVIHDPLPSGDDFADEGGANHTRFCSMYGEAGVQLFTFGRHAFSPQQLEPRIFPSRQTFEASQAITRLHRLSSDRVVFAQQHPDAIDAGVFHNDVISVGNQNVYLYHEYAFVDIPEVIEELQKKVHHTCQTDMILIPVREAELSLADAVSSYLFNSQIVTLLDGNMTIIAPEECALNSKAKAVLERICQDKNNPIEGAHFFNVRESMKNGGGPACLRLRVVLADEEIGQMSPHVFLDDTLENTLYDKLTAWINKHYREILHGTDLADPALLEESRSALDELTQILRLGSIYSFQ